MNIEEPEKVMSLYEKALKEIPQKWFERKVIVALLSGVNFLAADVLSENLLAESHELLIITAAVIYIIGSVKDKISTDEIFTLLRNHEGLEEIGIIESSPFLPNSPTTEEVYNLVRNIPEFLFAAVSILIPASGITVGIYRYIAGVSNDEIKKRLLLIVQNEQD